MVSPGNQDDLVPLHTDFDVVWRGYRRDQVRHYVESVEAEFRLLRSDRDVAVNRTNVLARELEELRIANRELHATIDRICRTPIDREGLSERLERMIDLAHAEAEEITSRAEASAEQSWSTAREAAAQLRARHERMLTDLEIRRQAMETEHRELITEKRSRVEEMAAAAVTRRRRLDEQATHHRQQVEQDFEIALSQRRAAVHRELEEQVTAARAEAESTLTQAQEQARDVLDEAQREVAAIRQIRDRLVQQIRSARQAVEHAAPLLDSEEEQQTPSAA